MTLIELIVVISIVGILVVALGFEFRGWMANYNVESQMKQMYNDLMNARVGAMGRNRAFFADFPTASSYRIREDTNEDNDPSIVVGDTILPTFPKTLAGYLLTWTGPGGTITFNANGLTSPNGVLWLDTNPPQPACCAPGTCTYPTSLQCIYPDYNCINVFQTRINMGKRNATTSSCDAQ